MIFGSLFSGIEAASAAWLPLGWRCAWTAEIDPFACAVLRHHYPNVPNLGDITKVRWNAVEPVDLVVGGPPCQDFSVAGQRAGLEGGRGALSLAYVRALDAIDPVWCLTENVPGWLSMGDNSFGHFLARLVGHDAPLVPSRGQRWTDAGVVAGPRRTAAWRICDAQYFGVPQRRRRVFVLASRGAGNWACADALFPVREGVQRDFAPRREAGQDAAAGAGDGSAYSRRPNAHDAAWRGDGADNFVADVARCVATGSNAQRYDYETETLIVPPLMSRGHSNGRPQPLSMGFTTDEHIVCFSAKDHGADAGDTAPTLRAGGHDRSHANAGVMPAIAFQANAGRDFTADTDRSPPLRSGGGTGGVAIAHALRADGFDASEDGTGRGTPLVAVQCNGSNVGFDLPSLRRGNGHLTGGGPAVMTIAIRGRGDSHELEWRDDGIANAVPTPTGGRAGIGVGAVAFHENQRAETYLSDTAESLNSGGGKPGQGYPAAMFDPTARQPEWSLDRAMKTDGPPAVAFTASEQANGYAWERPVYPTLHSQVPNDTRNIQQGIRQGMSVRRLTPVECERLQGFPDNWTDVPYRSKPAADGSRYKSIGNSMAVPVIAWLGRRIQRVTDTMELSDAAE